MVEQRAQQQPLVRLMALLGVVVFACIALALWALAVDHGQPKVYPTLPDRLLGVQLVPSAATHLLVGALIAAACWLYLNRAVRHRPLPALNDTARMLERADGLDEAGRAAAQHYKKLLEDHDILELPAGELMREFGRDSLGQGDRADVAGLLWEVGIQARPGLTWPHTRARTSLRLEWHEE